MRSGHGFKWATTLPDDGSMSVANKPQALVSRSVFSASTGAQKVSKRAENRPAGRVMKHGEFASNGAAAAGLSCK